MSALDPTAERSATVRAVSDVVVARLTDTQLEAIGERFPEIWRRLAVELGKRLRQRNRFVRIPNDRPQVFVGSSVEMLPIARAIQGGLAHDDLLVTVWTDDVFGASKTTLDGLLRVAEGSDFGILIVGPDDVRLSRGVETFAPRDNVVFELGLFMGATGQARSLIVKERDQDIHLPTDILGLIPIEYAPGDTANLAARIAPVCTRIRTTIQALGVK